MALQEQVEAESWWPRRRSRQRLLELDALRRFVMEDARRYAIGLGPVESGAQRVAQGEWSFETALRGLVDPESTLNLTSLYAHALVVVAQTRVWTEPALTVLRCRLLAAACLALDGGGAVSEPTEIAVVGAVHARLADLAPRLRDAAGVQAIVAALWPLADEVAPVFFEVLYRQLAHGTPRLEAQAAVRAANPQARHWAGFCYLGGWDVEGAIDVPESDRHLPLTRRREPVV